MRNLPHEFAVAYLLTRGGRIFFLMIMWSARSVRVLNVRRSFSVDRGGERVPRKHEFAVAYLLTRGGRIFFLEIYGRRGPSVCLNVETVVGASSDVFGRPTRRMDGYQEYQMYRYTFSQFVQR